MRWGGFNASAIFSVSVRMCKYKYWSVLKIFCSPFFFFSSHHPCRFGLFVLPSVLSRLWRKPNLKNSSFNGKAVETISRFVRCEWMRQEMASNLLTMAMAEAWTAILSDFFSPFLKRSPINAAVMVPCTAQPSSPVTPRPGRLFSKARFSNSAPWGEIA